MIKEYLKYFFSSPLYKRRLNLLLSASRYCKCNNKQYFIYISYFLSPSRPSLPHLNCSWFFYFSSSRVALNSSTRHALQGVTWVNRVNAFNIRILVVFVSVICWWFAQTELFPILKQYFFLRIATSIVYIWPNTS